LNESEVVWPKCNFDSFPLALSICANNGSTWNKATTTAQKNTCIIFMESTFPQTILTLSVFADRQKINPQLIAQSYQI
jgi:hypothetical protein